MTYKTLHTQYGLQRMAAAESTGVPINLTHIAVGDGNGNPVEPSDAQTQLVRERFRATVNRVYQDPSNPLRFTAELVIPATEGGFTLREVGVFDADGGLFVVGNLPETYKPTEADGAYSDTVVRVEFVVSNATVVTLQVDPNVAVATQTWITNNVTAALMIPGGTTGQILTKASNADGDTVWSDPDAVNVTVDTIEETQTLAADQTIVDLVATTHRGLAVYIDGVRLRSDQWTPDPVLDTRITLATAYAAGTKLIAAQNEPTGNAPAPLERSKNLSDVENKAAARTNLDIYNKAETRQMAPAGLVAHFARATAPTGWLKANGAAISRTAYADLFAAIGTTFGAGDGFNTFNLPDLRGEFLRGVDDGRGVDGGRALGSAQLGANQSHSHSASSTNAGSHSHDGTAQSGGQHNHAATSGTAGNHTHALNLVGYGYGGLPDQNRISTDNTGGSTNSITEGGSSIGDAGDHTHSISVGSAGSHDHSLSINAGGTHAHAITVNTSGEAESRPRNVALLACIKF